MSRMHSTRTVVVVVVGLALLPAAAFAQSAIAGQVKDNTGAVLPGATVEAASPALIEGSRSVVTDGVGRFTIVNLRPGVYTVTFALEGFAKVVREGIQLPSNFTATVDATLNVGSVQETVTVTGASPVVDVQQVQRSQVLDSQLLEAIVNSGSMWTQANMVAGVRVTGADVGGSQYGSCLQLESHGASSLHNTNTIEGLSVDNASGDQDGSDNSNYYTQVANQEIVIETSGGSAEYSVGGVRLNMIPKDGGNTFSGTAYVGGTNGAWQSDNFTQRLKSAGLRTVGKIDKIWDYSATVGGPIVKNRLWFHFSARKWGNRTPVTDAFYDDGSQYKNEGEILGVVPRLTWQATPRNKFTAHLERQGKSTGPKFACCAKYPAVLLPHQVGADPETATSWKDKVTPYGAAYVKWSSPINSRLLLEAGNSMSIIYVKFVNQLGIEAPRGTPEWYSRVRKVDIDRSTQWNSVNWGQGWSTNHELSFAASYVTGTHNVKVGIQDKNAQATRESIALGDIQQIQYRSGVPDSVIVGNYPVFLDPHLNYDVGLYAQDRWALNRLTLSYGLRIEWLNAGVREVHVPAGRFTGPRDVSEVKDAPNWGPDASPRVGLAYDLFGNAKTAVKLSVGKYLTRTMTAFASLLNPLILTTASLPWNDRDLLGRDVPTNIDGIAQDNELDVTRLPANFGTRTLTELDPNYKREYNVETSLSVQHELLQGVSVIAGWYHRSYYNIAVGAVRTNDLRPLAYNQDLNSDSYVPVQVVSPYNGEVFTVYDLKSSALLSQVHNLITNSKTNAQVYNGFEFALEGRLPGGGTILTSSTIQRARTNLCDSARDNPNKLRFCDRFNLPAPYKGVPFRGDFKLAASYPLPFRVQVSADFTSSPGRPEGNIVTVDELLPINWNITRTTRYTAANCAGRPCTAGALVIPNQVQTSVVVPLAPAGTARQLERQNQLNFGVRKVFRTGRYEWVPELNLFNALNADTVLTTRSDNFGTATYDFPARVIIGRMPRLALRMKW